MYNIILSRDNYTKQIQKLLLLAIYYKNASSILEIYYKIPWQIPTCLHNSGTSQFHYATTDAIYTISLYISGDIEVPHLMCTIWYALDVLFTSSTIIHLTMISVDRYMALKYPLKYGTRRSSKTALKIIIVWVLAFCAAGPLFVLSMLDKKKHVAYKGCGPEGPLFVITATVITFYLPLLIMTVMYVLTVLELHKQSKLQQNLQKINLKPVTSKDESCYSIKRENSSLNTGSSKSQVSTQNKNGRLEKRTVQNTSEIPLLEKSCSTKLSTTKSTTAAKSRSQKTCEQEKEDSLEESLGLVEGTSLSPPRQLYSSNGSLYVNNNLHHKRGSSTNVSEYSNGSDTSPESRATTNSSSNEKKENFVRKIKFKISHKKRHKRKLYSSVEKSRKAVQVLGVLFVVFVICYLPFFLTYIIKGTCVSKCPIHISDSLLTAFEWLGYSASMLNPIIYHIFNKKFRKTFYRLIRCQQCKK